MVVYDDYCRSDSHDDWGGWMEWDELIDGETACLIRVLRLDSRAVSSVLDPNRYSVRQSLVSRTPRLALVDFPTPQPVRDGLRYY